MYFEEHKPLKPHPLPLEEIKAALSDAPLFFGTDLDALEGQLARVQGVTLHDGEVLLSPQHSNRRIFIVADGTLRMYLQDCERPPLVMLRHGECIGELSIIDRNTPSAYVIAEGRCQVLAIDQQVLWAMVESSHVLARNLLYTLSRRARVGHPAVLDEPESQLHWQHLATIDPLTDLHNRHWLGTAFSRQLSRCRSAGQPLSLVMLDIDHFQHYNEEHGHAAGDQALTTVSHTMRDHLRPNDIAVRYGGEEFVILLPNTKLRNALKLANALCASVAETSITLRGSPRLPAVTISLGVTEADPESNESPDDLLARADVALSRAKQRGGNQVEKG